VDNRFVPGIAASIGTSARTYFIQRDIHDMGHSDVVGGAVVAREKALTSKMVVVGAN